MYRALPVKAACQGCRRRKQKCDGLVPCSRCSEDRQPCQYTKSRRGIAFAHLHRSGLEPPSIVTKSRHNHHILTTQNHNAKLRDDVAIFSPPSSQRAGLLYNQGIHRALTELDSTTTHIFSSFYAFFWPSHPFLPPQHLMRPYLISASQPFLEQIICHIGSLFLPIERLGVPRIPLPPMPSDLPVHLCSVQALLLLAICSHMYNDPEQSSVAMQKAISFSLELGLDRSCSLHSANSVYEESSCRTWWEVYILDTMFTAMHNETKPQVSHLWRDASLPVEDHQYQSPVTNKAALSMLDFENNAFAEESITFSSYTYRIVAARILSRVLSVASRGSEHGLEEREVELLLENFRFYLPKDKQNIVNIDGTSDEQLFQAQMIIFAASIYFHRPRSAFSDSSKDSGSQLDSAFRCTASNSINGDRIHYHTTKALRCANELSHLTNIIPEIRKHTPLFTCALALQSVIHLSAVQLPTMMDRHGLLRQQVLLAVGALQELGSVWPLALCFSARIKEISCSVFDKRMLKESTHAVSHSPTTDELYAGSLLARKSPDDVLWLFDLSP